ncbi:hypothetical protein BG011_002490 [Mortierella polycephala]|uniref:Uncharacterized protein n=1 Tax=Mortierella polycephala TaxID=41804 RepID=A0A9P6QFZ8_9FUNG|nr:hypothetical protein BG011_002490 [Mortierella polycephala]
MKIASILLLSVAATVAYASQGSQHDELYAGARFAKRGPIDGQGKLLPRSSNTVKTEPQTESFVKRHGSVDQMIKDHPVMGEKTNLVGVEGITKRCSDDDCFGKDRGHHSDRDYNNRHHGGHKHDSSCDCGKTHHRGGKDKEKGGGVRLDLDAIIDAKIKVILKAYVRVFVGAIIDVKADVLAKICLKLDINLKADIKVAAKLKALVDARVDAVVKAYVNADIKARVGDVVRGHCSKSCSSNADSGILVDIVAKIKIDLEKILVGLDDDILVDIRLRLDALGIKVKADVDLALGLDLGGILKTLVGDCKKARSDIIADLRLVVDARV